MRFFPNAIVLDNFFENPDEVRKIALSLEYARPVRSNYPGERSGDVQDVAPDVFKEWREKFLDIYGGTTASWEFRTQFQRIPTLTDDPEANEGWVHCDPSEDIGGVIYLNPEPDPDAGTTFVRPKKGMLPETNAHLRFRNDFYGGRNNISREDFIRALTFNNKKYEADIVVCNNYNRFVSFNCKKPHKQTTFGTSGDYRLTQVFFARKVT